MNKNKNIISLNGTSISGYLAKSEILRIVRILRSYGKKLLWFKLMYTYALTLEDLIHLKVGDIDLHKKIIKIGNGKKLKLRTLKIPTSMEKELTIAIAGRKPEEFLIQGRQKNSRIHKRTIQKLFGKIREEAGIDVTVTMIRKSAAIHMLETGWGQRRVSALLGHSSTRSTKRLIGNIHWNHDALVQYPIEEISQEAA